ncbi:MAG: DUF3293 domain-containing protein [Polyangia bacterium]|jgi:hypothetical protein
MSEMTTALRDLCQLDGKTFPDTLDREALLAQIGESSWLRFALGVAANAPMPAIDDAGLERAAREFAALWPIWLAYRECVIELDPPGSAKVRFCIDPAGARGRPPESFPASTFAVITAWNPGSGEPRPNERANRKANERLAAHLDARMVERWPAVNAPGSRWREESFAVLGIDLDEAWRIGEAFGQQAIFYVDQGRPLLVARRRGQVVAWEGVICLL